VLNEGSNAGVAYADAVSRLMGEQIEMRVLGPERRSLLQRLLWRTA
jgi:septum site-determining protein MinD